jgi:hypothetical protein
VLFSLESWELLMYNIFLCCIQPNVYYCLLVCIFSVIESIYIDIHCPKNKYFVGLWVFLLSINVILLYSHLIPIWVCSIVSRYYLFLVLYVYIEQKFFSTSCFWAQRLCLTGYLTYIYIYLSYLTRYFWDMFGLKVEFPLLSTGGVSWQIRI